MSEKSQLKEMLERGPVSSLFRAEQAESYLETSARFAEQINSHNLAEFFIVYQSFAIDMFVVSVTKMYEQPNRRYQLNSIPAILRFIKENASKLKIEQPHLLKQLIDLDSELVKETKGLDGQALTLSIVSSFEQKMPSIENNSTLDALKALRDKYVVHSEDIQMESLPKTSWGSTQELLLYAQRFIGLVGNGYLSTLYSFPDGNYVLSQDASRLGRKTVSILRSLGMDTSEKIN